VFSHLKSEIAGQCLSLIILDVSPVTATMAPDAEEDAFHSDNLTGPIVEVDAIDMRRDIANLWKICHFLTIVTTTNQLELQQRIMKVRRMCTSLKT
jgi:hypothetical protein